MIIHRQVGMHVHVHVVYVAINMFVISHHHGVCIYVLIHTLNDASPRVSLIAHAYVLELNSTVNCCV